MVCLLRIVLFTSRAASRVSKTIYILFDQVHPRTAHGIYGQQVSGEQVNNTTLKNKLKDHVKSL